MQDEKELTLQLEDNPLAKTIQRDDGFSLNRGQRRINRAQEKWRSQPDAFDSMIDHTRRERMQVEQDVGKLWHFPSDYLTRIDASATRPRASRARNTCVPRSRGHATDCPGACRRRRPLIVHSSWPVVPLARSGSAWNSLRRVGSIRYVAPSGGLTTSSARIEAAAASRRAARGEESAAADVPWSGSSNPLPAAHVRYSSGHIVSKPSSDA